METLREPVSHSGPSASLGALVVTQPRPMEGRPRDLRLHTPAPHRSFCMPLKGDCCSREMDAKVRAAVFTGREGADG